MNGGGYEHVSLGNMITFRWRSGRRYITLSPAPWQSA
jgi:hypothetical protein